MAVYRVKENLKSAKTVSGAEYFVATLENVDTGKIYYNIYIFTKTLKEGDTINGQLVKTETKSGKVCYKLNVEKNETDNKHQSTSVNGEHSINITEIDKSLNTIKDMLLQILHFIEEYKKGVTEIDEDMNEDEYDPS